MRLLFKQRFFSWFDSYDIYDDNGATVFTVEGKLAWGHCLHILNAAGEHIGTVQQRVLTFLPKFDLYEFDRCIGTIKKEFTFFVPHFTVEGSDWAVEGQFMEWDYAIVSASRGEIARISKELLHRTDTYVADPGPGYREGQRQARHCRDGVQGAVPLDGHLRHRRGGPRRRAARADGRAGHRRGEMQPQQLRRG